MASIHKPRAKNSILQKIKSIHINNLSSFIQIKLKRLFLTLFILSFSIKLGKDMNLLKFIGITELSSSFIKLNNLFHSV